MVFMSYDGAGLYDDDAGHDIRSGYRELVADGLSGEAATDALVAEWGDALSEPDEAAAFWLALADTQWKVGRLEDRVRERALGLIASGEDLARFEHDPRLHARRAVVLADLEAELRSPQRKPSRIRKPFRAVSPVGVGDVFWFAMPDGRRWLLRCVAINGDERSNSPTVEVLDWSGPDDPHDTETLRPRHPSPYPNGQEKPDLLWLVRYPRDPDPAVQVTMVATATRVTRQDTLPATMTPWVDLPERLEGDFGL
jgi:hypothetical protein